MPSALAIGAPLIGGAISGVGSWLGGNALSKSAQQAAQMQQQMFQQGASALNPFITGGSQAWDVLAPLLGIGQNTGQPGFGSLTKTFAPTMEQLEGTPGYQFTLGQGLKATQNAAAAKGLGSSGAAVKGAAQYAKDLASTTYQQQFENYWNQNKNIFGMLFNPLQQGASSAAALMGGANTAGKNIGDSLTGAGSAQAAMYNSMFGNLGNAFTTAGNNYLGMNMFNQMQQPGYGNVPGQWNPNVPGGMVGAQGPTGQMYAGSPSGNPLSWGAGSTAPGYFMGWPSNAQPSVG